MDISNGSGGIDSSKFIDYFTKQLPLDLAQMATLRDELERRQGAMTAVDASKRFFIICTPVTYGGKSTKSPRHCVRKPTALC
jgi:hypothetical protein